MDDKMYGNKFVLTLITQFQYLISSVIVNFKQAWHKQVEIEF